MARLRPASLAVTLAAAVALGPLPPLSQYRNAVLADLVKDGRSDLAAPFLRAGTILGDQIARNNLGVLQMRGEGVAVDWHAAQANFVRAANAGIMPARYNLGTQHDIQAFDRPSGDPVRTASQRFAVKVLRPAAEAGDWRAAARLAHLLFWNELASEVPDRVDLRDAMLRQAAASGDPEARLTLAYELLIRRIGTNPPDADADRRLWEEAWPHVRAALDQGIGKAAWLMAVFRQLQRSGHLPLPPEADRTPVQWLVAGAELGDELSICYAGQILSLDDGSGRGWGVTAPDYPRARAWLEQCGAAQDKRKLPPVAGEVALYAADPDRAFGRGRDDAASALLRLGDLSRDGLGQPPDRAAARAFYERAAEKGLEEARRRLSELPPP
ncbi:MAG TPA: hypothetical protein VF744_06470 [Beijerinckiaceae bacterium]|jgi:TPR repeat protein